MRIIQKLTSWSDACVSLPGLSSQHLRLVQRTEDLPVQDLVAELAIELST